MDNENTIDFGVWNVPTSWDDLTLKQFQEIEKFYSSKEKDAYFDLREVLHILTNKTIDEINALPIEFVNEIMNKMTFLEEVPKVEEPKSFVEIEGETYLINVMEKLKTGEYVAIDQILKNDSHDYVSIFAVLLRKKDEIYDSKFEAEMFEKRVELMGRQPVTKMLPLIGFFLNLFIASKTHSLLYSEAEEGLNNIQQSINNSQKIGVFKKLSLNSQVKKLRKLLKSNKSI